jgi:hypothetical protein
MNRNHQYGSRRARSHHRGGGRTLSGEFARLRAGASYQSTPHRYTRLNGADGDPFAFFLSLNTKVP